MSVVLEKYFNPENLKLAYFRVQCWSDKMVKDQVGLRAFGSNLEANCANLSNTILNEKYKPRRGFKFYVPKASLTNRTKTILFAEDAIVYQAIANIIAANNYDTLHDQESFVFGSVLSPDVKKGVAIFNEPEPNFFFFKFWKVLFNNFKESIIHSIEVDKVKFKFETDITGFFDCIPHYNLLTKLSERFQVEDEILDMLSSCLNIWSGTSESITPGVGIPQGPFPSFFLANLLLHDLDEKIIGEGFKYYRYMDDIKIYGYEERELVKALVLIDKYLKGNGLSINSKKTKIEKIKDGVEDSTITELKKVESFTFYDAEGNDIESDDDEITNFLSAFDDSNKSYSDTNDEIKSTSKLSDQENELDFTNFSKVNILTDEKDIIDFWESRIHEVETTLPTYFENDKNGQLIIKEKIEDIDFIKLSAQYGTSFRSLLQLKSDTKPNLELIPFWLLAYRTFFWRANNFGLTLALYKNNNEVKKFLLELVNTDFKLYEWNRYFALQTLSFSQQFNDQELRQNIFKMLQEEESDLAKISIYRLLLGNSNNAQFNATIKKQLQKEKNNYIKILIADFNKNHFSDSNNIVEFLNSIGL